MCTRNCCSLQNQMHIASNYCKTCLARKFEVAISNVRLVRWMILSRILFIAVSLLAMTAIREVVEK